MQAIHDSSNYPLDSTMLGSHRNQGPNPGPWGPPHPTYQPQSQPQPHPQQQQRQQQSQHSYPSGHQQAAVPTSNTLDASMPAQPHPAYVSQRPASSSSLTPTPLSSSGAGVPRTSHRKMTAGSSPLATSSPLASVPVHITRIKAKPEMPTTLPPESVCECFICHSVSPYSQQPPPEIPMNQREELSRLAPTCPSIHLFCLASRLPMSLPLDATQKSPLTRSILDYFYSTWISDDNDLRGPRVQCLNFIPIHPITASCFDRYLEGQSWNKRVCRPLWHAADLRCKLGMEGMYRNCMQDKCAGCFIFNDGFESVIAKNKHIYLSSNSSRAHDHLQGLRVPASGNKQDAHPDNKVQCMVLTFAALGRVYDVPPGKERMKRPPKDLDVVRRQYEARRSNVGNSSDGVETLTGEEYEVFAADAIVPLVMVLYKVV